MTDEWIRYDLRHHSFPSTFMVRLKDLLVLNETPEFYDDYAGIRFPPSVSKIDYISLGEKLDDIEFGEAIP